jgi:Protein of unknown function (DUF3048) N-terminal domain/Protein of unknown function (DUF3048) C-terminal domain
VSTRTKIIGAVCGGVVVLAMGAFFVLSGKAGDLPIPFIGNDPVTCPLTGKEPKKEELAKRPAVALKIENAAAARPLSGLEDAELVYEELVEGGETRFVAFFQCGDAEKAGPIRSARLIDPAILLPKTRILGYSGGNKVVLEAVRKAGIVSVDEHSGAGAGALHRVDRDGVAVEHTLYADTAAVRRIGSKKFDDPPPDDLFSFGELQGGAKKASSIVLNFGGVSTIEYDWAHGAWQRTQDGAPFVMESGDQIAPKNVLVEEHDVKASELVDVTGTPSIEIVDETGSGRAVLFRDRRAIVGRWKRDSTKDRTVFQTKDGDEMVFAPGAIWIELVPSETGEVRGSFSFEK